MSSIYKNTTQIYYYQTYLYNPKTKKKEKYQKSLRTKDYKEALKLKKMKDTQFAPKHKNPFLKQPFRFSKVKEIYLQRRLEEVKRNERSENTYRSDLHNLGVFEKWLMNPYGNIYFTEINTQMIEEFIDHRRTQPHYITQKQLSKSTLYSNLRGIKSFFSYMRKLKYREDTPFEDIKIPGSDIRRFIPPTKDFDKIYKFIKREVEINCRDLPRNYRSDNRLPIYSNYRKKILFTDDSRKRGHKYTKTIWVRYNSWFSHFIWIILNSGMRLSELRFLKWQMGANDILEGSRMFSYVDDDLTTITINSKKNFRGIPITPQIQISLDCLKKRKNQDDVYVFQSNRSRGGMYGGEIIDSHFKKLMKSLDLDERYTIHSIRHSFATKLIERKWDLYRIGKILGHKSIVTTTQIYGHLLSESLVEVLSDIGE